MQTRDLPSGRIGGADLANESQQAGFSALDLWAFVLPAISFVEITIVGRLIVTEILLLAMLPWLWSARDRLRLPQWFVVLWAGWLIGQVATDLVVGSALEDYARGWAAIALTMTNFAAILVLASTPRRARIFAAGLAVGGILSYLLVPNAYAAGDPWKWAFALPVGLAIAAGMSGRTGARRPWLTAVAFAAFGALNLYLGFRSLGGVALLTSGYLVLSVLAGRRPTPPTRSALRVGARLVVLALAVVGTLQLYDVAASAGWLGPDAQSKYLMQSGQFGVLVGGRSELLVSSQAVIDSPILGHGSWAKDFTYADLLAERASDLGYQVGAEYSDVGLIPTHSYLMGSWVWAGLAGGLFWLAILAIATWLLANLYAARVALAPLLVFSTMLLLWSIAFSPYGFSARLSAPYGIALVLLGLSLLRGDHAPSQPAPVDSQAAQRPRSWSSAATRLQVDGRTGAASASSHVDG